MKTEMNANTTDQDVKETLEMSLISEEPSEELLRKLRVLAAKPQRKPFAWRPSLAIAGGMAVVALAFAMTLTPSKAAAKTYDTIVAAVDRVKAFEFSIRTDDKDAKSNFTILAADGKFTMRAGDNTFMQFGDGAMKFYDPKKNVVTEMKLGGLVDPKMIAQQVNSSMAEAFDQMDLKKELREFEQKYGKDHIKISPVEEEDGKQVYHVTMNSPDDKGSVEMTVDANTDVPTRMLVRNPNDEHNADIRIQFGAEIDPKMLEAVFPANAKVEVIDLSKLASGMMNGFGGAGKGGKDFDKDFGKQMEQFGEQFGKQMEQQFSKGIESDSKEKKGD